MHELYDHQRRVKSEVYHHINKGTDRVMVKAATGFGKTVLAASIIHDITSRGLRCIFTVPTLTLVDQTYIEFTQFGLDCGIIQGDNPLTDFGKPVQIASIQTIASHLKRKDTAHTEMYYKNVVVIVDEAHLQYKAIKWLEKQTRRPFIGLSATPWAKGLGQYYKTMVNGPDVGWLIDNGYLSKYRAFSHFVPDMKGVNVNASGDYSSSESGDKYDWKIVGDVVKTWMDSPAENRQTILFAPRVVDAERFALEFRHRGYTAVAVSGYMDDQECKAEVEKFRLHNTKIICSVAKLTTGFDVPDVGCIIDCQPTRSLMRHCQKLGRGLRTAHGKDDVIILDNAGNLLRNGLPDGDYPNTLNSGEEVKLDRKKKEDPLPKQCSKCNFLKPPKVRMCPSCGFEPVATSTLEVEDGELVELTVTQKKHNREPTENKASFFAGLQQYALDKRYKSGWAANKYKRRFGVWPNAHKHVSPAPPTPEVLGFIQSENIRYANRREQ